MTLATMSSLEASYQYLEALYRRPIVPPRTAGLARIEYLLRRLGHPEGSFRSVHVTGTCGKGSTATMIGSIIEAAGYRTGLFRSPHLESYRERIAVNSVAIGMEGWLNAFRRVRTLADEMESGTATDYDLGRLSLFEFVWAMGAFHFAESAVEFGVIEVGVGGRLSPTNVLQPDVAVLTNVSLDHTTLLGPTEVDIALEKAQIVKRGCSAVTAAEQPDVLTIVRSRCAELAVPLSVIGDNVEIAIQGQDRSGETFGLTTPERAHKDLSITLLGAHQVLNAAAAVAATDQLSTRGVSIPEESVRDGLAAARFPGRFEIVSEDPLVVLDGAHNAASAAVLRATLDDLFPEHDVILLIGVLGDKDAEGIVEHLAGRAVAAVVTPPPWEGRVGDLSRLTVALETQVEDVFSAAGVPEAFMAALARSHYGSMVLVTGSLYLVAAVRRLLFSGTQLTQCSIS